MVLSSIAADYNDQFEVKDVDKDGKKFDRGTHQVYLESPVFGDADKIAHADLFINNLQTYKVSRIFASSQSRNMEMTLDVHSELYPMQLGEIYSMRLTSSIERELIHARRDAAQAAQPWRDGAKGTIADDYDYVMHGKIYKHDETRSDQESIS
ncbi:hypothetical protein SmJEL517_g01251 [Synchytrium microbalum]|uniref:DNA-directed RNA polymerases I, II, and III subunit RPABC3 n=1 Tax=Synchytrium microbalum TaxID=1806994 RepID=A0A507CGU6_9FUNG|nr:uncharacterized protein SmJEL517_g01251 [Synchytrium microbalum]TPX36753.1 hypothetical protein SmJEL517_g01251 [Synchytrium microbalum]